jgi:hypothetical protein
MELRVNGQKIDITLEGEKTVGQVLKAWESEAAKNDATTISIKLNGQEISADDFESAIQKPIEDNTLIELSIVTKAEIQATFRECGQAFENYVSQLKEIPVLLQSGKEAAANKTIADFAEVIDLFCHTAALSALFPDVYQAVKIGDKAIETFFEEFAPVLKDFEDAFQNKDTVSVGDLAEYEISPRLEEISSAIKQAF